MNTLEKTSTFTKSMTLRFLRQTLKLPQKAMSPVMKVSQPTYSRMENEEKMYSPEDIEKIISSFGFKAEDLAKYEGTLFVVGNNFTHNKEVNYKKAENEDEKYKVFEEENIELKGEIKELKNEVKALKSEMKSMQDKYLEQIQRLFGMLEVKHQTTFG
jgi:transcriptional regulator with XRE-family HTH domain